MERDGEIVGSGFRTYAGVVNAPPVHIRNVVIHGQDEAVGHKLIEVHVAVKGDVGVVELFVDDRRSDHRLAKNAHKHRDSGQESD